jgi:hypothetical protein
MPADAWTGRGNRASRERMLDFNRLGAPLGIEHAPVRAMFDIEDARGKLNGARML